MIFPPPWTKDVSDGFISSFERRETSPTASFLLPRNKGRLRQALSFAQNKENGRKKWARGFGPFEPGVGFCAGTSYDGPNPEDSCPAGKNPMASTQFSSPRNGGPIYRLLRLFRPETLLPYYGERGFIIFSASLAEQCGLTRRQGRRGRRRRCRSETGSQATPRKSTCRKTCATDARS